MGYTFKYNPITKLMELDTGLVLIDSLVAPNMPGRNVIINGAMTVDQRDSDTTAITLGAAATHIVDRWFGIRSVTGGVMTVERDSTTPAPGFNYYLACKNTAAASAGFNEAAGIGQRIEAYNIGRFGFDETWAKELTLSFWVRSSKAGTYGIRFANNDNDRIWLAEYTISTVDTWEKKSIPFTADTGSDWLTKTNGRGLEIWWDLGSHSALHGTVDTWNTSNVFTTSNQFDWIGTTVNSTFWLIGAQLELGPKATPFEYRPYGLEFDLCRQYYEEIGGETAYQVFGVAQAVSASQVYLDLNYYPKRIAPTSITISANADFGLTDSTNNIAAFSAFSTTSETIKSARIVASRTGSGLTAGHAVMMLANNTLNARLKINSEF